MVKKSKNDSQKKEKEIEKKVEEIDKDTLILESLQKINQRLTALEEKDNVPEELKKEPEVKEGHPIPEEYRGIIDNVLNKKFGIKLDYDPERPQFILNIVVPKKYSLMSKDEWEMMGVDMRSRTVSYADGSNGVKEWAEKVYSSFTPEIQSLIVAERKESKK